MFSLYEERELRQDPTVLFLIQVPTSGLPSGPCHTRLTPAAQALTKLTPSTVGPPVSCTKRAVVYNFNICSGFGIDEINDFPRKEPTELICNDVIKL